ncbi:GNAT family N-acetyltransferase [Chitinophaga lutea]
MNTIRIIEYGSCDYRSMVALRDEVLRKPLGLSFSDDYLQQELNDVLIGYFEDDRLAGCCILTPLSGKTVQLRQMAVSPAFQRGGIGHKLLVFAEGKARDAGFSELMLHARKEAVPFYLKSGYSARGDAFIEVGIPHLEMFKELQALRPMV